MAAGCNACKISTRRQTLRFMSIGLGLALGAGLALPDAAKAQDSFPDRAVRIIVPFPAGGTADAMPRVVGEWLSRKWGQPVIIENRTGAGGNVGAETVARAEPDGYTLLSAPPPPLVINHNLYPNLTFDPTQFVPIAVMGRVPNALLVNPKNVPEDTVQAIIDRAHANPGKLTSATQGNGTTSHLTSELFQLLGKLKVTHVPYRGTAPALQGLMAGNVDLMFDNLGVSLPLAKAGKLKLIAVATPKRTEALPDVPAVAETLPGFQSAAWFAVVAPNKTPQKIAAKINADINEALKDPAVQKRLANLSAEAVGGSLEETSAYFKEEIERWHRVIKEAGVKLD